MKRKSTKPIQRRSRRTSYERALDQAKTRLERAIAEYDQCQTKIAALSKEIPTLKEIIRVLGPTEFTGAVIKAPGSVTQPHLNRFVSQALKTLTEPFVPDPANEDGMLPDIPE